MQVRMLVGRAHSTGKVDEPGEVVTVDKAEALRMLQEGQAEAVASKPTDRAERRPRGGTDRETR